MISLPFPCISLGLWTRCLSQRLKEKGKYSKICLALSLFFNCPGQKGSKKCFSKLAIFKRSHRAQKSSGVREEVASAGPLSSSRLLVESIKETGRGEKC
jgi:hypothetical protein